MSILLLHAHDFGHRYINGLEAASSKFATNTSREMLRSQKDVDDAFASKDRHSNSGFFLF